MFYVYYVFVRLCIPQFRSISLQLFDRRAMVLCVFNSILPGKTFPPPTTKTLSLTPDSCLNQATFVRFFFLLQECWFSSWDSFPSSTVGLMRLVRCCNLQTGCFTRYSFCRRRPQQNINQDCMLYIILDFWFDITGLVELDLFCELLSYLECSGP